MGETGRMARGMGAYTIAKFGMAGCWPSSWLHPWLRVRTVSPGFTETPCSTPSNPIYRTDAHPRAVPKADEVAAEIVR